MNKLRNLFKFLLAIILLVAGVIHLIKPQAFMVAMPPYIPFHHATIILTGILEIIFAIGLVFERTRNLSATLTALYFLAIIPAHLHIAINLIPMFGVTSPMILWGRVLFQFVFIRWAWWIRQH